MIVELQGGPHDGLEVEILRSKLHGFLMLTEAGAANHLTSQYRLEADGVDDDGEIVGLRVVWDPKPLEDQDAGEDG